mmetsp:Transcript_35035/g.84565  ORF Transcript_35035/g.84565 Transcript_35035/m.84565 type:complete len:265 (+) Transcript_35035:1976-2770(+)
MYAHATNDATMVGTYPAVLAAEGRLSNPAPSAVPHSNAEDDKNPEFAFLASTATVTVSKVSSSSSLLSPTTPCPFVFFRRVVVSYRRFEYSLGMSPLRYSTAEIIRDSSIFPTLSAIFRRRGGRSSAISFDSRWWAVSVSEEPLFALEALPSWPSSRPKNLTWLIVLLLWASVRSSDEEVAFNDGGDDALANPTAVDWTPNFDLTLDGKAAVNAAVRDGAGIDNGVWNADAVSRGDIIIIGDGDGPFGTRHNAATATVAAAAEA